MSLNTFYTSDALDIIFLHECSGIMAQYIEADLDRVKNSFFVHNFSWYVDDSKCIVIRNFLEHFANKSSAHRELVHEKVVFLFNSHQEILRARWFMPDIRMLLVNNCFSLSEDAFSITDEVNEFKAVYNAKPLSFKRHYLLRGIEDLACISYGEEQAKVDPNYGYFDIRSLKPKCLEWGIGVEQIVSIYNRASCGLILSDIEGACYASAEYLLCGLPVLSTVSYGGRSEYYDKANCIICDADADNIAATIDRVHQAMLTNSIDRKAIRDKAINKQLDYRHLLSSALADMTGVDYMHLSNYLAYSIKRDNKLAEKINYWLKSI